MCEHTHTRYNSMLKNIQVNEFYSKSAHIHVAELFILSVTVNPMDRNTSELKGSLVNVIGSVITLVCLN